MRLPKLIRDRRDGLVKFDELEFGVRAGELDHQSRIALAIANDRVGKPLVSPSPACILLVFGNPAFGQGRSVLAKPQVDQGQVNVVSGLGSAGPAVADIPAESMVGSAGGGYDRRTAGRLRPPAAQA